LVQGTGLQHLGCNSRVTITRPALAGGFLVLSTLTETKLVFLVSKGYKSN
jgi:hypothetical protein